MDRRALRFTGFMIAGIAWFALSVCVFAYTSNNANACSNQFIGAIASDQCTPWVAFHELSIACMWLAGVGTVIATAYEVYESRRRANGPAE